MNHVRIFSLVLAVALILCATSAGPANAKIMDEADVCGNFYAAGITDYDGTFSTSFLKLNTDGVGRISYDRLEPAGDSGSFLYAVFDNSKITTKNDGDTYYGAEKGAISPDGSCLTLSNMIFTTNGGSPSMKFAIRQSAGLTKAVMDGSYHLFFFYRTQTTDGGGSVINTNEGIFQADGDLPGDVANGTLSGVLVEIFNPFTQADQPLTGNYTVIYSINEDGRLSLTMVSGNAIDAFDTLHGVISGDGNTFVAVETSQEDGSAAFVIGVRQNPDGLTLPDIEGKYYVDDFGYYPLDDPLVNDAADFIMNLAAGADGTFSFKEEDTTCETCTIGTQVLGTLSVPAEGNQYTASFNSYPGGLKQGGQIFLSPGGGVFALISPLYLGIGIEQASGQADPGEPNASAGSDRNVSPGETIALDGSGSSDGDGTIVSWKWQVIGGDPGMVSAINIPDDASARTAFTVPNTTGTVIIRLTVIDNDGNIDSDWTMITVSGNIAPTAAAGVDQTVNEGTLIRLDGSGSSDPDDGITTYAWVRIAGPEVTLSNPETAQPSFIAPPADSRIDLVFSLTVMDHGGKSATDTVTITVNDTFVHENQSPVADAGVDRAVNEGTTVILDGRGSSDPDDGIATYAWVRIAGPEVTLSNPETAQPSFIAPPADSRIDLVFSLTVTDHGGKSATDTVTITINDTSVHENQPPVADAGADRAVNEGTSVTLDGSGSSDPDDGITTYAWVQIAGAEVTLSNHETAQPSFIAPPVDSRTDLVFSLTVTDHDGKSATDTVTITINDTSVHENQPPVADAGADRAVNEETPVTLDGSGSSDPDDGIATYAWVRTAGPEVNLSNSDISQPSFIAPPVDSRTDLVFSLTVTDTKGQSTTDTMTITVNDTSDHTPADNPSDDGDDGGGCFIGTLSPCNIR